MPQFGWNLDLRRCVGCNGCAVACKAEMNTPPVQSPMTVRYGKAVAVNYRMVYTVDGGAYPTPTRTFVDVHHCASPACSPLPPVGAIAKDAATGLVSIDDSSASAAVTANGPVPTAPRSSTKPARSRSALMRPSAGGGLAACATTARAGPDAHGGLQRRLGTSPTGFADPGLTNLHPLHLTPCLPTQIAPTPDDAGRILRSGLYRLPPAAFWNHRRPNGSPFCRPETADAAEALLAPYRRTLALPGHAAPDASPAPGVLRPLLRPTSRYVAPFERCSATKGRRGRPARGLLGGPSTAAVRKATSASEKSWKPGLPTMSPASWPSWPSCGNAARPVRGRRSPRSRRRTHPLVSGARRPHRPECRLAGLSVPCLLCAALVADAARCAT